MLSKLIWPGVKLKDGTHLGAQTLNGFIGGIKICQTFQVLVSTSVGDIDIELWSKETPKACRNFVQLCLEDYYDNTIFHRIVKGEGVNIDIIAFIKHFCNNVS